MGAAVLEFRVYAVTLPHELAQRAEDLAARESRIVSELLSEAFRAYYAASIRAKLDEIGEYAASLNSPYTEADIPRLISEVRAEEPKHPLSRHFR